MVLFNQVENITSPQQREHFYYYLNGKNVLRGIVISTCNRLEYYSGEGFIPEHIVSHLFLLTAGLKSKFIGDTSILGQVRDAYREACQKAELNKSLHKLFQTALFVGKRVRNETRISVGAITYSQAAMELLCTKTEFLKSCKITLIGINNINEKIIRCLIKKGVVNILIGNRSFEKAKLLAEKYNCSAFSFGDLKKILNDTDILISATSAPHYIVTEKIFPAGKSMLILDLAIPNVVEECIGQMERVSLIKLSQIENQVNQNLHKRYSDIEKAGIIIDQEVKRFMKVQTSWNSEK